jgi:hypothetical protein
MTATLAADVDRFSSQFQRITITQRILPFPGEDLVSDADPESALHYCNNFASDVPLGQLFECFRNCFQSNLFRNGWCDLPCLDYDSESFNY